MKKALFIDRDGTLIKEPADEQIDSFEKLSFYPGVFEQLSRIARMLDFELVMVTNQDGLGTEAFPEADFWPVHRFIIRTFAEQGICFDAEFIDRTFPADGAPTRKSGTAMLTGYMDGSYDLDNSYVIGDRLTDMELAKNLGARGIFINNQTDLGNDELNVDVKKLREVIDLETSVWEDISRFLLMRSRAVLVSRRTSETDIKIGLNLDGEGQSNIDTGIKFFDHMLEQLSKHGQMDLEITVKGDLEVDEHHTIEDTAIALGEAFSKALGNKLGVERYGFSLPMDDCLAQVAIDFGGRSWLVWDAEFNREMIGGMPTEMFYHFFKSFADGARANINIKAEGTNEHHKIESIYKAWARAIRSAVKRDSEKMVLPSTKGLL
jgi:imidazoleglycerol-phosphate dehydratase/histidinol-phosphatase